MLRYIGLVWDNANPAASQQADALLQQVRASFPTWTFHLSNPGLAVCSARPPAGLDTALPFAAQRGVALGKLFEASETSSRPCADQVLDSTSTDAIVQSGGRKLVDRYWGRYVAFVNDPARRKTFVVRDPTGRVHCYYTTYRDVTLFFSRLADCERLAAIPFTVNQKYIAGYALYGRLTINETGLNEVREVLPGECLEISPGSVRSLFHWNPLSIATTNVIEEYGQAVTSMRNVVRDCVHSWSSCFDGILHYLSGGLDSSIVLASLVSAPKRPRLTCLNYFSAGSDTDERGYARLMAERAKVPLVEWCRNDRISLSHLLGMERTTSPCSSYTDPESTLAENRFAREHLATARTSGNGGDWLFYLCGRLPAAVDYVYRHGISWALPSIALDSANLERQSLWRVLHSCMKFGLLKQPLSVQQMYSHDFRPSMLADIKSALKADESLIHPLYRSTPDIPKAKLFHAYMITWGACRLPNPFEQDDGLEVIEPLCSQPLMELSLRTPVYLLAHGGRDRAVARDAFASELPDSIARRNTKGGMAEHARDVLSRNAEIARELLLDGILVRERYVDRQQIEESLSTRPGRARTLQVELFSYLSVEAWYRSWQSQRTLKAA